MLVQICAGLGLDRRAKEVFGGELQWFAIAIGFIEKAETYMLDDRFDSIIFSLLFLNLLLYLTEYSLSPSRYSI